jgi:hypothetical protein
MTTTMTMSQSTTPVRQLITLSRQLPAAHIKFSAMTQTNQPAFDSVRDPVQQYAKISATQPDHVSIRPLLATQRNTNETLSIRRHPKPKRTNHHIMIKFKSSQNTIPISLMQSTTFPSITKLSMCNRNTAKLANSFLNTRISFRALN